jgi:small subunit ribosomal protein S15
MEHIISNRKDNSNKRALRVLVHQRQQILKYFARKEPEKYDTLLGDLGLTRRGVEGEINLANILCTYPSRSDPHQPRLPHS